MGGGAPRSSCLGGEGYFLSGAQPLHRLVSSASDSESIPLKRRPYSTSKSALEPLGRSRKVTRFFFSQSVSFFPKPVHVSMAQSPYGKIWRTAGLCQRLFRSKLRMEQMWGDVCDK